MQGRSGISEYFDGVLEHDDDVGKLLKTLDDLGIADNTIVLYTTDNGPHMNSWPDGAMTPFRSEKNTNWEGAFRVPAMIRWPGLIKPGTVSNDIVSGLDWFPTFLAAAGDPRISVCQNSTICAWKDRLLAGWRTGGRTYNNHLDGFNQLPYLTGKEDKSSRKAFFYFNDVGQLVELETSVLRAENAGHAQYLGRALYLPQTPIGIGRFNTPSWPCRHKRLWHSSLRRLMTFRLGRSRRASTSSRSSSRCNEASARPPRTEHEPAGERAGRSSFKFIARAFRR
jgi:Sulfatase